MYRIILLPGSTEGLRLSNNLVTVRNRGCQPPSLVCRLHKRQVPY